MVAIIAYTRGARAGRDRGGPSGFPDEFVKAAARDHRRVPGMGSRLGGVRSQAQSELQGLRSKAVGGEVAGGDEGAPAGPVCAVCAGRPCACDVAVLAGLLRDAADFPLPGGVAVVSVRAAAEAARRGNDRAH